MMRVALEIALGRRRRANVHRFVGLAHVRRARVGVAVDGDRRDAELAAGADDAQRDLAAVGDENLGEHRDAMREHVSMLQRNVPVLLRRIRVALRAQRLERVDETRPRVARIDDVVE